MIQDNPNYPYTYMSAPNTTGGNIYSNNGTATEPTAGNQMIVDLRNATGSSAKPIIKY